MPGPLEQLQSYCEKSSIHGLGHAATNKPSSKWKRLLWFAILISSFCVATKMVHTAFSDWKANPTFNVVESTSYPLEAVDFPTVTICPESPDSDRWGMVTKVFDYLDATCTKDETRTCQNLTELQALFLDIQQKVALHLDVYVQHFLSYKTIAEIIQEGPRPFSTEANFKNIFERIASNNQLSSSVFSTLEEMKTSLHFEQSPRDIAIEFLIQEAEKILGQNIQCNDQCKIRAREILGQLISIDMIYKGRKATSGQYLAYYREFIGIDQYDNYLAEKFIPGIMERSPTNSEEKLNEFFEIITELLSNGKLENVSILDLPGFGAMADYNSPYWRNPEQPTQYSVLKEWKKYKNVSFGKEMALEVDEQYEKLRNLWKNYTFDPKTYSFPPNQVKNQYFNFTKHILEDLDTFANVAHESLLFSGKQSHWDLFDIAKQVFDPLLTKNYTVDSYGYGSKFFIKCSFKKSIEQDEYSMCSQFIPSLTSNGICYSFNGLKSTELWKDGKVLQAFARNLEKNKPSNHKFRGAGPSEGLQFFLNMQPFVASNSDGHDKFRPYTVAIHSKVNMIDQKTNVIKLRPGYYTSIKVVPDIVNITEGFIELEQEERKCKLSNENGDFGHLKSYSKIGCEFECAVKEAKEICKCLPWYYPNNFTMLPMCDMFGAKCFDIIMTNNDKYKKCPEMCKEDCKYTSYTIYPTNVPLDTHEMCKTGNIIGDIYIQDLYVRYDFRLAFERYIKGLSYAEVDIEEECKNFIKKYVTFVNIEAPSTSVLKARREERNTFFSKLAIIGGTLGLFSGMSLLSFVEILFCLCSVLRSMAKKDD